MRFWKSVRGTFRSFRSFRDFASQYETKKPVLLRRLLLPWIPVRFEQISSFPTMRRHSSNSPSHPNTVEYQSVILHFRRLVAVFLATLVKFLPVTYSDCLLISRTHHWEQVLRI